MSDENGPYPQDLHTEKVKTQRTYLETEHRPFKDSSPERADVAIGNPRDRWVKVKQNFWDIVQKGQDMVTGKPSRDYVRVSKYHRRNMTEKSTSGKAVWGGDQPGDIYGATSDKGGSMDYSDASGGVRIEPYIDSYYRTHAWGLMDDSSIGRVENASSFMRKNGLPTERPRDVKNIKEIWVSNVDDKGRRVFEKKPIHIWEKEEMGRIGKVYGESTLANIQSYLDNTEFIVLTRDLQVDERLKDIGEGAKINELKKVLTPILRWVNVATESRASGLIPDTKAPEKFDPEKADDLKRYLVEWLPDQMGTYLGRFHKIGLSHRYLHAQNWSAVGTIYDLDSVAGKGVYETDEDPSKSELDGDLNDTLNDINSLILLELPQCKEFALLDENELALEADMHFIRNYVAERFDESQRNEALKQLQAKYNNRIDDYKSSIVVEAYRKLADEFETNFNH